MNVQLILVTDSLGLRSSWQPIQLIQTLTMMNFFQNFFETLLQFFHTKSKSIINLTLEDRTQHSPSFTSQFRCPMSCSKNRNKIWHRVIFQSLIKHHLYIPILGWLESGQWVWLTELPLGNSTSINYVTMYPFMTLFIVNLCRLIRVWRCVYKRYNSVIIARRD